MFPTEIIYQNFSVLQRHNSNPALVFEMFIWSSLTPPLPTATALVEELPNGSLCLWYIPLPFNPLCSSNPPCSNQKVLTTKWVWSCFFPVSNLWMAFHGLQNKANSWEMQTSHGYLSGCPYCFPWPQDLCFRQLWYPTILFPGCSLLWLSFSVLPVLSLCLEDSLPSPTVSLLSVPSRSRDQVKCHLSAKAFPNCLPTIAFCHLSFPSQSFVLLCFV